MIDWNQLVAGKLVAPKDAGQALHNAWGYKPQISMSSELRRVLALPRRELELDGTERAETIIDMQMELYARPEVVGRRCRCVELDPDRHREEGCISRLRLPQAQALREIAICGGALCPIGVGHGKTLVDLLGALAFQRYDPNIRDIVLLVPPGLAVQLEGDYVYYGQHFKMPQIVFHGIAYENKINKLDPRVPLERTANSIHVVPYSRLSRPESTAWLEKVLVPQAIIADEAHKLRSAGRPKNKGATGSRIWRYMEDIAPTTKFVGLSGSMTAKSISDYWHLAKWSLRGGSPLPTIDVIVDEWGTAINPSDNPAEPGQLMDLCAPGEHLYAGFKRRVAETIGVVTTATPSVDVELTLSERTAPPIPPTVKAHLKLLKDESIRPDGEELLTSLELAACAMQLSFGFYYRWIYPRCEFPRDEQLVIDWKAARKAYFREVRQKLKDPDTDMDSPRLVMNAAERYYGLRPKKAGLPTWECKSFPAWNKLRGMVYNESEAICFDDFIVQDTVAWARAHRGVVWYEHDAIGEWLAEVSAKTGEALPKYGGGKLAKEMMLGNQKKGTRGEDGSRSIICSVKAHGTGTNGLQHRFKDCLVLHITPDPNLIEQTLGRLHRPGQNHDVNAAFYRHTEIMREQLDDALASAGYVENTGFGAQKILRAWRE